MNASGLCSLLGFPLFRSTCLFLTRFLSLPLFVTIHIVLVLDLLRALSIVRFICFRLFCHFAGFIYFLGYVCSRLDSRVRRVLPTPSSSELSFSSNGSSESRSESFSKLSSHQIPRCLDIEGTTTAKGLYANLFYVLTHYAFGALVLCLLLALSNSTSTLGVETGVFRRREGPPRQSISDTPFFLL